MVLSIPVCVSTCANAATSPIQVGTAGFDSGVIWTVTGVEVVPNGSLPFSCAQSLRLHGSLIAIHQRLSYHGTSSKTLLAKVSITSASCWGSLAWQAHACL